MIDSDVRVSNIVGMPKEWATVDQIGDECTVLLEDGECVFIPWTVIEPVRLTKEWIVKFGFDIEMIKGTTSCSVSLKGKEYFLFSDYGLKFYFQTYNGTSNHVDIEYVHQLQNLYHSLTGKHLSID